MSNEDKNLITINLFVIGDEGVGKKTFISRINSMSCTHSHKNKNKFKPKEEKKPKKEEEEDENQDEIPKKKSQYIFLLHHQIN
jgi:septin family protein